MRLHIPVRPCLHRQIHKEIEEQAEMNLIAISNMSFDHAEEYTSFITEQNHSIKPTLLSREKSSKIKRAPKRAELEKKELPVFFRAIKRSSSVGEKTHKKVLSVEKKVPRANSLEFGSDQVLIVKKKLPIALSHYLVMGKEAEVKNSEIMFSQYRPKPNIKSVSYFKKGKKLREKSLSSQEKSLRYEKNKLEPLDESYNRKHLFFT